MKCIIPVALTISFVPSACVVPGAGRAAKQAHAAHPIESQAEELGDGIPVSSFEAAKLDEFRIRAGIAEIAKGAYGTVHSLLIFRDGKLVSESYFPGQDWNNHQGPIGLVRHNRDTLHDVRSISKTVVALSVLIAHDRGQIASLDQPLFDFFPEYAAAYSNSAKAKITLKHALTMTAGLDWDEHASYTDSRNAGAQLAGASDPIAFVLGRKLVSRPGATFNYNGGLTQLLAAVVERATGSDIETFTKANLLEPLGITRSEWAKRRDGKPDADSGLRLRSRDLAKIGLLIAKRGSWDGKQILPARLIDEAVAAHIDIPQEPGAAALGDRLAYGYQTWLFSFVSDGKRVPLIELSGNGGQKIYIDRARDLIVVTTAGDYDRHDREKSPIDIYFDVVEPALLVR